MYDDPRYTLYLMSHTQVSALPGLEGFHFPQLVLVIATLEGDLLSPGHGLCLGKIAEDVQSSQDSSQEMDNSACRVYRSDPRVHHECAVTCAEVHGRDQSGKNMLVHLQ